MVTTFVLCATRLLCPELFYLIGAVLMTNLQLSSTSTTFVLFLLSVYDEIILVPLLPAETGFTVFFLPANSW